MNNHKYYTDWNEFWAFYMKSVQDDLGEYKYKALQNSSQRLAKNLSRIKDDFRLNTLNPLIRKAGMVPDKVKLVYDPSATTFYSSYSRQKKSFYIGYPTFTKYMCFWEPAMKAAFRHEMGHILRGDCLLQMDFSKVRNANCCMDIRINDQLEREALEQVYKCLYFKDKDQPLLVPEQQFEKIDLPYDEKAPFVPEWWVIANKFNQANQREREKPSDDPQDPKGYNIGDYVIINTEEAGDDNGKPGKIIDIQNDGELVVERISDEEYEMIMASVEAMRGLNKEEKLMLTQDGDIIGVFTENQVLPMIPEEEGESGDYGDDGDDGGDSGKSDDDTEPGEGGEPGGEPSDGEGKTPEDIIKEKEEILEGLLKGGIDGETQGGKVWDDEFSSEEDEEEMPSFDEDSEDDEKGGAETDDESEEKIVNEEIEKEKEERGKMGEDREWTEEQMRQKEELDAKIADANLTVSINKSIKNFRDIKTKYGDKLTKQEVMYIDNALDELEKIK